MFQSFHAAVADARLQFDSRCDGFGGNGIRPIAVGNQFQRNASNAQPIPPDLVVRDFERSMVPCVVCSHYHPRCWQPAQSLRATTSPTTA